MSLDPPIVLPAGYVTGEAIAFSGSDDRAVMVTRAAPLPVAPTTVVATSTPLAGSASASTVVGPFVPQLGREIVLTLSGTWAGTVALQRSVNGGTTRLAATLGGAAMTWSGGVNEIVWVETEAGATLYLDAALTSGTLTYRVAQ